LGRSSAFKLKGQRLSGCPTFLDQLPDNMASIEVHLPGPRWKWESGQRVFLPFAGPSVLETHPFGIANECLRQAKGHAGKLREGQMTNLLVRTHTGFTARLWEIGGSDEVSRVEGRVSTIAEGPYDTILRTDAQHRYYTVVLVGGGGGISGVLPLLGHLSHLTLTNDPVACAKKGLFLGFHMTEGQSALN
jgi:hypothetical protein